ncbi:MAG: hypothetical protein ABIP39_00905 [Polyangiaceae bacterium]
MAEMRQAFEARTGSFGPEDPWFEARSSAFWDDAVTSQGFSGRVSDALPEAARGWLQPLARAHRGLFRAEEAESKWTLVDVWSGAEFIVDAPEGGLRQALDAAEGSLIDGRLVGRDAPLSIDLLPGAIFHPPDASEAIEKVIEVARAQKLGRELTLDALLRMERNLRSHSRVKPAYAYRSSELAPKLKTPFLPKDS